MKENVPDELNILNELDVRNWQLIAVADETEWQWFCSHFFSRFIRVIGVHLIISFCTGGKVVIICFLGMFWLEVINFIDTLLELGLFGLFLAWLVGAC
ncbi:hypothetical protein IV503_30000 [Klebsiella huaxiensis]|uniref:hypothetical protein n=1 Tax=Klebsiella huaxiensis TaxID=2153354 RepID=UPI002F2BA82F